MAVDVYVCICSETVTTRNSKDRCEMFISSECHVIMTIGKTMYVCRDVEEAIFMLSNSVLTGFRSLYLGQALTPDY
jgi:hypothetical protein